jgi:hypothetical protein
MLGELDAVVTPGEPDVIRSSVFVGRMAGLH